MKIFLLLLALFFCSLPAYAATTATANYYLWTTGADTNGGGFDPGISGAGTNYANVATPQVVFSAGNANLLTCVASSTTLISAGTPFTSAMVGNAIQITGGTNFLLDIYWITAYTNSSTVTLDRTPATAGAGALGTGNLGGALLTFKCLSNGGTGTANPLNTKTQIVAGNTINIRGSGSNDPSSVDYDFSGGYYSFPAGSAAAGYVQVIGFNGRPYIKFNGLFLYNVQYWAIANLKLIISTSPAFTNEGFIAALNGAPGIVYNCIFDQNGQDANMAGGQLWAVGNEFRNTGSTSAGTAGALVLSALSGGASGNYFTNIRGTGIVLSGNTLSPIINNLITKCGKYGISIGSALYNFTVFNNTIAGCTSDGINISGTAGILTTSAIMNNIFSNNGGYGLNVSNGSLTPNNQSVLGNINYNNYYSNTSGPYNGISAGANDTTLNPQYVNSSSGNYAIGANMEGIGFPPGFSFPLVSSSGNTTTSYPTCGAVEPQVTGGGGSSGGSYSFIQ